MDTAAFVLFFVDISLFVLPYVKHNWTAVTEDGSLSAQFEHTLLITEDGSSSNHGYTAEHGEEMREESG